MRLHDRYLLRELLTPLAFCLGAFLIFGVSIFYFSNLEEFRAAKLKGGETLAMCVATLPEFLVQMLPMILLLALLYALTQHAKFNELTALRAAGVSLWRLCAPYFAVGLAATGIYFALNEWVVPRCSAWATGIKLRHLRAVDPARVQAVTHFYDKGYRFAQMKRQWKFGEFAAETTEMTRPVVHWTLPDGSLRFLQADRAVFTNGAWTFFKAYFYSQPVGQAQRPLFFTNQIAMEEFSETPAQLVNGLKLDAQQSWKEVRNLNLPLAEIRDLLRDNPEMSQKNENKWLTKLHARIAAPWTCLVVVLIAIPFGTPSGRRNLFFGVAGSIFICFAYFVLQIVSQAFGVSGHLPGWLAAWLPNFIFAAVGIILTLRVR